MKPVHVVLIAIATSLVGIIAVAGTLFVGFVGVYHGQNGRQLTSNESRSMYDHCSRQGSRMVGFSADYPAVEAGTHPVERLS